VADHPEDSNLISVSDAIHLKNSINQGITWGNSNLNALQVETATKLTAQDYARIRKDYREWNVNVFSTIALALLTLGCFVGYLYLPYWWLRIISMSIGISCFYIISKRDGHAEGYVDGYVAGHEAGIHKALGITSEELSEMHGFATDMKIDGMLIEKMGEREKTKE
jgi:hypothetical protein